MPVFKFTSPEGQEYYGEGADTHSAFQDADHAATSPHEIAAMRTRRSVTKDAGPPDIQIPEAAQAVKRGDYGPLRESAFESAGTLASVLSPVGAMLGEAISPTAIAAGGMFDAEPDAKKRRSWQAQYDQAGTKGKRDVLAAFNADQAKVQEANRRQQEEERHAASAERERTAGIQRRSDWEQQNAEAIGKLPQTDRDTIKAAGSLPEAQSLFAAAMERRRQAGMTLAERYPAGVLAGEAAAVAGDIYAPFRIATGRAKALGAAADEAESLFKRAYGKGAKATKGTDAEAQLSRKVLEERTALPSIEPGELALGATVPYVAGNIPNAIDLLMGTLSSDPGAKEKVQHAWESATDPMQFLRSIGVGLGATALGSFAGGAARDIGSEKARATGILNQFSARDLDAAAKAAAAAARKKELGEAKAAAIAARMSSRESAAAERERVAAGDIAKTQYAAATPKAPTPIQQAALDAEAAKQQAAAQRSAIRALKPAGKSKGAAALSPGAAAGE